MCHCSQSWDAPSTPVSRLRKTRNLMLDIPDIGSFDASSPERSGRGKGQGKGQSLLQDSYPNKGGDRGFSADKLFTRTLVFLADAVQGMLHACNPAMAFLRLEMEHALDSQVGIT